MTVALAWLRNLLLCLEATLADYRLPMAARLVSFLGVTLARLCFVALALVGLIIGAWIFSFGLAAAVDSNPIPLVVLELVLGAAACGALGWLVYRTVRYAAVTFAPRKLVKPIAAATTLSLLWLFALFATIDGG